MPLVYTNTIRLYGTEPVLTACACDVTQGIGIHFVGLADAAVKESLLRTVTALQAFGYRIPGKKIIINLAPADLRKDGTHFDLPIALSILAASGQENLSDLGQWLIVGELALDGYVRAVDGAVQAALSVNQPGIKGVIIPADSAYALDGLIDEYTPVYAAGSLREAIDTVINPSTATTAFAYNKAHRVAPPPTGEMHWDDVKGQVAAKRALEIAAAGGHNLLLVGPSGAPKQELARIIRDILPPPTGEQLTDNAKIYSTDNRYYDNRTRPFRAPHYSSSISALLGGGVSDRLHPGEVSLANNGILFLDEVNLMPKALQEALRGPLEDRKVVFSRLKGTTEYPADFMLVGAMDPCPCGQYGLGDRCTCTPNQRGLFTSHLSPSLYDRLTVCTWVSPGREGETDYDDMATVAARVAKAREIQKARFAGEGFDTNERMMARDVEKYCVLSDEVTKILETIVSRLGLSARAYMRIIKIARTIADLEGSEYILPQHVAEASSYRFLDRRQL